jgi:hypothetical protein
MKYGIGVFDNSVTSTASWLQGACNEVIRKKLEKRNPHSIKKLVFHGFNSTSAEEYTAGSGGFYNQVYDQISYDCPLGTFILTPQPIGSTIRRLYHRQGIEMKEAFHTTWNVGLPELIASIGYDPGAQHNRNAIQIHADARLMSEGCIVMAPKDFAIFAYNMKFAFHETHSLVLEVSEKFYTIMPAVIE